MRQFSRYLTVGVLNTAFGYAVIFALMYVLGVTPQASNAIGYCVGLMTSYLLNRTFTFRSSAPKLPEFVRFVAIFLLSFAANFACLTVLLRLGTHAGLSQLIAGVVYVATSYLLSRSFVFRPRQAADAR